MTPDPHWSFGLDGWALLPLDMEVLERIDSYYYELDGEPNPNWVRFLRFCGLADMGTIGNPAWWQEDLSIRSYTLTGRHHRPDLSPALPIRPRTGCGRDSISLH